MQSLHEAICFEVCDASQRDQLCALAGFLKLRDACFGLADGYDLVIAGMNGQNREAPPRPGRRRTARYGNHSAETIRVLLRNVPGARAAHAETGNDNLFWVDAVASQDAIEQVVHRTLVFGSAPVTSYRIGRNDDCCKLRQRRTN